MMRWAGIVADASSPISKAVPAAAASRASRTSLGGGCGTHRILHSYMYTWKGYTLRQVRMLLWDRQVRVCHDLPPILPPTMAEATAAAGALETTTQKQPPAVTPERLKTRIVAFALVAAVTFLAVFALGTSYSPAPTPLPPPPAIRPSSLDSSHQPSRAATARNATGHRCVGPHCLQPATATRHLNHTHNPARAPSTAHPAPHASQHPGHPAPSRPVAKPPQPQQQPPQQQQQQQQQHQPIQKRTGPLATKPSLHTGSAAASQPAVNKSGGSTLGLHHGGHSPVARHHPKLGIISGAPPDSGDED